MNAQPRRDMAVHNAAISYSFFLSRQLCLIVRTLISEGGARGAGGDQSVPFFSARTLHFTPALKEASFLSGLRNGYPVKVGRNFIFFVLVG